MQLDDGAAHVQPKAQPDPGAALHMNARRPMESLPDAILFLHREPWPLVAYPDSLLQVLPLEPNSDGTVFWRIFQGVGQIIRHDLLQTLGIPQNRRTRLLWQLPGGSYASG